MGYITLLRMQKVRPRTINLREFPLVYNVDWLHSSGIPVAFVDCLGGLLSVCAEEITLELEVRFKLLWSFVFVYI